MKRIICFADPNYYGSHAGGAEIQMMVLAREFLRHGWEVHYVSGDVDDTRVQDGIHCHPCPNVGNIKNGYENFRSAVAATGAQVLYQRGRKQYTTYLGAIGKDLGCGTIFATSMDIDCRLLKETPRVLENIVRSPGAVKHLLSTMQLDRQTLAGARSADVVLTQSKYQQRQAHRRLGLESHLVHNMFPVPDSEWRDKEDPAVVLWLTNLKSWKQPRLFLRLVRDLADLDCRFLMAGRLDGDEKLGRDIKVLEQKDKRFKYLGGVAFERTQDLFRSAAVFVNTSQNKEGVPNAFIQAWLARTPVISLNVDLDGVIENNGLGVVSGKFKRLCEDVRRYVEDAELRKTAGDRSRAYAVANYDIDKNFHRLLRLAESLLPSGDEPS